MAATGMRRRPRWLPALALLASTLASSSAHADGRATRWQEDASGAPYSVAVRANDERWLPAALPLAEQAVRLYEELLSRRDAPPPGNPRRVDVEIQLACALNTLGRVRIDLGDYAGAGPPLMRASALLELTAKTARGWWDVPNLYELGRLARIQGDYAAAERFLTRVTSKHHPHENGSGYGGAGYAYAELGCVLAERGDYARAEPLLKLGIEGAGSSVDAPAPGVSEPGRRTLGLLDHLAELYLAEGRYQDAEGLLRRVQAQIARYPELSQEAVYLLPRTLDDVGAIALATGSLARATELFTRARAERGKIFGEEHPDGATSLEGLGEAALRSGDVQGARGSIEKALSIREAKLGKGHPDALKARALLGDLRRAEGDAGAAAALYQEAIAGLERALGQEHPKVGAVLLRLASLRREGWDLETAKSLGSRAVGIFDKAFGEGSRRAADARDALAETFLAEKDVGRARGELARSLAVRDAEIGRRLASGTEEEKSAAMEALRGQTDLALALPFVTAEPDETAVELAFTAMLRRKGRVLDALVAGRAALRDRSTSEDVLLLRELGKVQSQIVDLVVSGRGSLPSAEYDARLKTLDEQRAKLEAEVSRRSASLRTDDPAVTLEDVERAIPEGAALVEIALRTPLRARAGGPPEGPRYAAFVVESRGRARAVDLGPAAPIDALVAKLREALADPLADPRKLARALDAKVTEPLRALLGPVRWILLSPDGALNLVPFAALVDERGRYLIEGASFTYLTTGRDLLRYTYDETPKDPGPSAIVVGAPDFGDARKKRSRFRPIGDGTSPGAIDMSDVRFNPLPGTAAEANAVARALPGAKVLVGAEATEEAIKAFGHPRILHLATHGFFLPVPLARSSGVARAPVFDNPLFRGGIALASANQPVPGREDGVLTAMEASGLDLYGTKLVVLSACETGIGEARAGEGVYGLRRALVVAGAQTQVISLWKVSDEGTRDMMVAYYRRLQRGEGRSEAMRAVALEMLARPDRARPYYWASFIVSGDGASLDGKDISPDFASHARVRPSPRGCGCAVPGSHPGGGGALALALASLATLAVRAMGRRERAAQVILR
jgi:CHAT domain-containing protein